MRLLCLLVFAVFSVFSQTLPFAPIHYLYSGVARKVVFTSANPNEVHIYDPVLKTDKVVPLTQPPMTLALSLDGSQAAVGQNGFVTLIDVVGERVSRIYPVAGVAANIVLVNNFVFIGGGYYSGTSSAPIALNLSTGASTPSNSFGAGGAVNPVTNSIYATRDGTSPNDVEKFAIEASSIRPAGDSPYHGDYLACGRVWNGSDYKRLYTGCGTTFAASLDPKRDMHYMGSLPTGGMPIQSLAPAEELNLVAAILAPNQFGGNSNSLADTFIQLYQPDFHNAAGELPIEGFLLNGTTFTVRGKAVFFDRAGRELVVVGQVDPRSGLLYDHVVRRYPIGTPTACVPTFRGSGISATHSGGQFSFEYSAPADCVFRLKTNVPWLAISIGSLWGTVNSGNGSMRVTVREHLGEGVREGFVYFTDVAGNRVGASLRLTQSSKTEPDPVQRLYYNVVDAAYSKALDRIITVSASPNELHILDPKTREETVVSLAATPLSVSVHPNGEFAAVGCDSWVLYINLRTGQPEINFPVLTDVQRLVLAGNGNAYLFPRRDWSDIYTMAIPSGAVTATSAIYNGRLPRLHVSGNTLYVGGSWFSKWDIRNGVARLDSRTSGSNICASNFWLSEDGNRLFDSCGKAFRTSEVPSVDLQPNGSLQFAPGVTWAAHSRAGRRTAVIGRDSNSGVAATDDTAMQFYGDEFLGFTGAVGFPKLRLPNATVNLHGRMSFWDNAENGLWVLAQAPTSANLVNSWSVFWVEPSEQLQPKISVLVHGASFAEGAPITGGQLISLFGSSLGPVGGRGFSIDSNTSAVASDDTQPEVFVGSQRATVIYSNPTQINAITPRSLNGSTLDIFVRYRGAPSNTISARGTSASPGIFTMSGSGSGQAVAFNPQGMLNSAAAPAKAGEFLTLYFTGGTWLDIDIPPTLVTPSSPLRRFRERAQVTVGGRPATVTFAGPAPGFLATIGQLNIQLAQDTPSGTAQPVILTFGSVSSTAQATIAVQQ